MVDRDVVLKSNMNMSITVEKVRDETMALSTSERASLAHDLILSLDRSADYTR